MKKLKLQVQISVDGYMGGPNGEMDWMTWNWDDKLVSYVQGLTDPIDCILLGRKMAGGFNAHWAGVAANPSDPQHAAGKKFHETAKVVFTHTLKADDPMVTQWHNTTLATGTLADEVQKLKNQEGGDLMVYGGSEFVSNLVKENLVDEYHLFVNPAAIGKGIGIFGELTGKMDLELKAATAFECGIVVLKYEPKR